MSSICLALTNYQALHMHNVIEPSPPNLEPSIFAITILRERGSEAG